MCILSSEKLEDFSKILDGETYSRCSVFSTTKSFKMRNMFAVNLKLQGWNEDVVMEVIHKYFNHSPNKVLALKLKISSNEPFKHLLRCPLLAELGIHSFRNLFLAPIGAQGVTMSVCLSVRPAHYALEQSIFIFLGQRAIREQSSSQRALRAIKSESDSRSL